MKKAICILLGIFVGIAAVVASFKLIQKLMGDKWYYDDDDDFLLDEDLDDIQPEPAAAPQNSAVEPQAE